jgi:hypothetical protein
VFSLYHHLPLAPDRAAEIAGVNPSAQRTLLFGCGALGSKLALHRARAGNTALTAVDRAPLAGHNLVRHGLTGDYRGLNKAEALRQAITKLFGHIPPSQQPKTYAGSALDWLHGACRQHLKEHHLLIDATASVMMLDALSRASLPAQLAVARCALADSGRLGWLTMEGKNRNPRVDDLQAWLYDQALEHPALSQWLKQERRQKELRFNAGLSEVPLGLGCSSITMRLPDELVSLHAAQFSLALRDWDESTTSPQQGWLIWQWSSSSGLAVERLAVEPVLVIPASGAAHWQVRMQAQAAREIRQQLLAAAPNETGGVMIGVVNPKRRIIYVTRLLPTPADSAASPTTFKRGTRNLPIAAEQIYEATGGMLGYVGDWHTHPRGSGAASPTDIATLQNTKRNFDMAGLPTFILIATPRGFRAYIKEAA